MMARCVNGSSVEKGNAEGVVLAGSLTDGAVKRNGRSSQVPSRGPGTSGDRATIADWKSWSREERAIAGGRNGVGHYWPIDRMRYYSESSGAVCSVG